MSKFARAFIGGMDGGRVRAPARPASPRSPLSFATAERPVGTFALPSNFLPVPSSRLPARPMTSNTADTFDLIMKCAREDKPAALRFQRSEANPKHFLIREILTRETFVAAAVGQSKGHTYRDGGIFFDDVQCPHCSTPGGTLYCYSCRSLICRGGVTESEHGLAVRCTQSCGASGSLRAYRTPSQTVYQDRICIGHIEAVLRSPRNGRFRGNDFFDCCDRCDLFARPALLDRRRS
jgi:hypothetical protein